MNSITIAERYLENEIFIVDEGFLMNLRFLADTENGKQYLRELLDAELAPKGVVHITIELTTCLERIRERGKRIPRYDHLSEGELAEYLEIEQRRLDIVADIAASKEVPVLKLAGEADADENAGQILDFIEHQI